MKRLARVAAVLGTLFISLIMLGCETFSEVAAFDDLDEEVVLFGNVRFKPSGVAYHGKASWYSIKTNRGTVTASGERLSNSAATAAHKTLPFGTKVKVTNLANGRSEVVRITDRGPYIKGRIIDVTIGTAQRLGMVTAGVVPVKVEVMEEFHPAPAPTERKRRIRSFFARRNAVEDAG
ncbi:MAG: septal ring lytic transglycosylase RlpA family protein [Verrucomicrobiota bacterium]